MALHSSAFYQTVCKNCRCFTTFLIVVFIIYVIISFHRGVNRHVHQLKKGYKPDKNKVDDMCLFADVITNFTDLQDCQNYNNIHDWSFNCKVSCSINIPVTQRQREHEILHESCHCELKNNIFSFRSKDPCLSKTLQKLRKDKSKVPNIVHYIWLGKQPKQFQFYNFLSLYSVYKFQNPYVILIHGETIPYGEYWKKTVGIVKNIFHVYTKSPETIFRKKIKYVEHKADIVRLQVLQEYGGIYLDTDTILLRSLDSLRNYTFSMSKTRNNTLGNGLLLSTAGSKFIDIWLQNYITFNPKNWGQHSVYLPFNLSIHHPELIHVENRTFLHGGTLDQIFMSNFKWSHLYALHLYIRYYKKCIYDEYSVCGLNTTLGSVARYVLFDSKELCPGFPFSNQWHVLQLKKGYKPDKNKVDDMCLFADVITNFTHLKDCQKYNDIHDWGFNCKVSCSISIPVTTRQREHELLPESCHCELKNNIFSFRSKDPCLSKTLQKLRKDKSKVPNIVHYIWLGKQPKQFQFYNFLSLYSVYKFQNPYVILIHGETIPYGEYWEKTVGIVKNIFHVYTKSPETIFRKKIKYVEHKADIVRLQVLQEYGGIYLDTDTILLRSLDSLRNYTFSMSKTRNNTLGNGLILSTAESKFIDIWLQNYITFNPKNWGQHSVYLPFNLSIHHPELIHVENRTFLHGGTLDQIFMSNFKWSHLYALHLYIRYYKKCIYDEYSVCGLNTTLGSVARYVLFGSKELCPRFPFSDQWVNITH